MFMPCCYVHYIATLYYTGLKKPRPACSRKEHIQQGLFVRPGAGNLRRYTYNIIVKTGMMIMTIIMLMMIMILLLLLIIIIMIIILIIMLVMI